METSEKGLSKTALRKSKKSMMLGLIALIAVIILISIVGWIVMKPEPEVIQGEVEANEVRVSGKLAGRIESFKVEEGDFVKQGDLLVSLSSPELLAKLAQAEAAESAAQAQNKKAIKGARYELIQGAYEMWQKSKVGVDIAEKTYKRAKNLFDNGVIPAQKFDEAEAQYNAAIATEKGAKTQYVMAKNGAEKEDKLSAVALVNRAKGAVSEVEAYMPERQLTAPISGEISEIYPKRGELVGQGAPIMSIVDLNDCWITFNVREDQLIKFKMGAIVKVDVPAIGAKDASFKITYIKGLGSYATWKATKTTGQFDMKTFEVRAKPIKSIDGLRPGMSVLFGKSE